MNGRGWEVEDNPENSGHLVAACRVFCVGDVVLGVIGVVLPLGGSAPLDTQRHFARVRVIYIISTLDNANITSYTQEFVLWPAHAGRPCLLPQGCSAFL